MGGRQATLGLPRDLPDLPSGWCYKPLGALVDERGISYGIVQPGKHESDGVPVLVQPEMESISPGLVS